MKMYTEADVDRSTLSDATVAVIGYGSQGRAHALNLRDSGIRVIAGLRPGGASWEKATADGLEVATIEEAAAAADLVAILAPDIPQAEIYATIEPKLREGACLLFAHGFNIHFRQIEPRADLDVIMIAPKGPGDLVRRQYQQGKGVPCLVAIHANPTGKALDRALAYADGIGGTRAGVIETTFKEETETDLFGEQAVLCGGATELVLKGFETLVEAGYQPEVAYYECMHELKLIVDLLHEGGLRKMHEFISETAQYGDLTRGPRVIDDHVKDSMRSVLRDIQEGAFAEQWIAENRGGRENYRRMMDADLAHPIEAVGAKLRAQMDWLEG